jgi:hypothetical protein
MWRGGDGGGWGGCFWPCAFTAAGRKLDGCYAKLLRYALKHKWSGLEFVSIRLLEKQLSFAGHCIRSIGGLPDSLFYSSPVHAIPRSITYVWDMG